MKTIEVEKSLDGLATLCFLVNGDKVLLGIKTRNIGKDCRNGAGGGVEVGETIKEAAFRELKEELGVRALERKSLKVAVIEFHNTKTDGSIFICRMHVYLVRKWVGKITRSDELEDPKWFNIHKLPIDDLMPADREWLPFVLDGKRIIATFKYGPYQKELLEKGKVEVKSLSFTLPKV